MIRLLWDCVTLDANSYPEVAFSRKELVLASGNRAKLSMCVTAAATVHFKM